MSIGKTSNEVKRRWIDANDSTIRADVLIPMAEAFREKCKSKGIPQAQGTKSAIEKFLAEE